MAPRAPRECTETKCEAPVTKLAVTLISWSGDGRSSRHDRIIPRQDRDKSVGAGGISLGDARKTEGDACSRREHASPSVLRASPNEMPPAPTLLSRSCRGMLRSCRELRPSPDQLIRVTASFVTGASHFVSVHSRGARGAIAFARVA